MLPPVDPVTKLLPATADNSPHSATVAELEQVFVLGAPFPAERRPIFDAFMLFAFKVWDYFPNSPLWVNGGFVTHKTVPPKDVDVAVYTSVAEINSVLAAAPQEVAQLLTLQGVTAAQPGFALPRLQPFGGYVDSFLITADVTAAVQYWKDQWSRAPLPDGSGYRTDIAKGFVEVTP